VVVGGVLVASTIGEGVDGVQEIPASLRRCPRPFLPFFVLSFSFSVLSFLSKLFQNSSKSIETKS
jgi:hypothetical protein